MSGKNKIAFVQNEEPLFIRQFKEKTGYKEGPTVDTKREMPAFDDDDDRPDLEDEMPVVVVLRDGDLTAEEAEVLKKQNDVTPGEPPTEKITFKRPEKRSAEKSSELSTSTIKKKKDSDSCDKKSQKKKTSGKEVKNTSLLSFDDEEDDT
ncbi:hypothetical protein FSP39_001447 [Pinctada imbricata]|uniref:DUF4604 domain-containing protein n=1 Tax=Pinctada imbricata TaxID=66713 RepID=A0AA89BS03_PINIB|nr:hypothetical protein FSP39_001447 [Pinctada imbricata]